MTATASPKYKSREEIFAAGLSPFHGSEALRELIRWEQEHPTPPAPLVVTPGERAELSRIKSALEKLSADFETLESRRQKYTDDLPAAQEKFNSIQNANLPDAPDAEIIAEITAEKHLQKIRQFLANASPVRELLVKELSSAFTRLNSILARFQEPKFFPNGSGHFPAIAAAIQEIEKILAQK